MKRNRRNDCLFLKQEIGKQTAQKCRNERVMNFLPC